MIDIITSVLMGFATSHKQLRRELQNESDDIDYEIRIKPTLENEEARAIGRYAIQYEPLQLH